MMEPCFNLFFSKEPISNKYEKACKEFLKGCLCAKKDLQEECETCLKAFLNHIRNLAIQEDYKERNKYCEKTPNKTFNLTKAEGQVK